MERHVLIVYGDKTIFNNIQKEWQKVGIFVYWSSSFSEAVSKLSREDVFLLIVVFSSVKEFLSPLKMIREMTNAPILILRKPYDSMEKWDAIEAGADEYIAWTENYLIEVIGSGKALIRRYTELNQASGHSFRILTRGSLFMSVNYRRAFVNTQEITLSRREFDLLYYLASNPGRVFTNEQLYSEVWGEEYLQSDAGLHSCLNRIRRKLEEVPGASCRIENLRGVGYRFIQEKH